MRPLTMTPEQEEAIRGFGTDSRIRYVLAEVDALRAKLGEAVAKSEWAHERLREMNHDRKSWGRLWREVSGRKPSRPTTPLRSREPESVFEWLRYYANKSKSQQGEVRRYGALKNAAEAASREAVAQVGQEPVAAPAAGGADGQGPCDQAALAKAEVALAASQARERALREALIAAKWAAAPEQNNGTSRYPYEAIVAALATSTDGSALRGLMRQLGGYLWAQLAPSVEMDPTVIEDGVSRILKGGE